jgi:dCTP deaminase
MILNDKQIELLAVNNEMIFPFIDHQVREVDGKKQISSGLSSFGYDITLADTFKAYNSAYSVHQASDKWGLVVDPLDFNSEDLLESFTVDPDVGYAIIPPHGYFLGHANEYMRMPNNVSAICLTKSTYARTGIFLNTTPIEAGWHGIITLEIANLTERPVKLYINQGICQLQFFGGDFPKTSYADRGGKYQGQLGITLPKG